jgi:hypothetical protein
MREKFENLLIIIGSIVVGIPLGVVVGLICWFKFPFQIYWAARANLALQRVEREKVKIKQYETGDIWEKHIQKMEEKKSYDN